MVETSVSLLKRLSDYSDNESWHRLVDLYMPVICGLLRQYSIGREDAEDLAQEVLAVIVRKLPEFEHDGRKGAFRTWLRIITVNRVRAFWRSHKRRPEARGGSAFLNLLCHLEDPSSDCTRDWNHEHDRHLMNQLCNLVQSDFEPGTWRAFWRVVMDNEKPTAVAAELGMTVNAVVIAKSRVLKRLREEGREFSDWSE